MYVINTLWSHMLGFPFQLEETSNSNIVATISDKKLFVKAKFSRAAIEDFKRSVTAIIISLLLIY